MKRVMFLSIFLFSSLDGIVLNAEIEKQNKGSTNLFSNNSTVSSPKLDSLIRENAFSHDEIENLKLEILKLRTKQEFFGNFLDEQTARFSIIVAAILSLIGIFTYTGFKIEINRINAKIQESISAIENEFRTFKDIMDKHEQKMSKIYTEFFASNMERYAKEGQYFDAFWFALYSAQESTVSLPLLKEERKIKGLTEWTIKKLENATSYLANLVKDKSNDARLLEYHEHFLSIIDDLNKSKNRAILDYAAELRVSMNAIISRKNAPD